MPYTQFVEVGRAALVTFGPLADKLAVVVDIIDDKRVMIDLVNSTEPRQVIPTKRLRLTDFVVKIERGAAPEAVAQAVQADKLFDKWSETAWAKRIQASHAKLQLNDFQRFKYAKLHAQRAKLIREKLAKK